MQTLMSDGLPKGLPWPKGKRRLALIEHPNVKLMLADLAIGPATIYDLAALLRVGVRQVYQYLRVTRTAGMVRIVDWERTTGGRPVYGIKTSSMQRDAPRLPRLTSAENKRRWRAKRKTINAPVSPKSVAYLPTSRRPKGL